MLNYYYEYFEYSPSRSVEATNTYARVPTHTHSHTHSHTHTHAHTHTHTCTHTYMHTHTCSHTYMRTHTHTQTGWTLHILVSGISSEGALELRFGATAQVHETNFVSWCIAWRGHLIRQYKMSFYKFWWSQELNILKETSFALVRTWKNGY